MSLHYLITWKNLSYSQYGSVVICFSYALMMVVLYFVSSSVIPENFDEVRLTACEKINEHSFGLIPPISQNALLCLRRMEMEKWSTYLFLVYRILQKISFCQQLEVYLPKTYL